MNARELGSRDVAGWLCDGSIWPVCQPCALPEEDWLRRWPAGGRGASAGGRSPGRPAGALLAAARASLRERWRYPLDLLGSAAFLAVVVFIFHRLWTVLASERDELGGFTVTQLVAYLVVTEVITMAPGPAHLRISEDIRSGAFAVSLLRPVRFAQWELARTAGGAFGRAAALAPVGVATLVALQGWPSLDPRGLLVGVLLLAPAALLLDCSARVVVGLLAFWVEDSAPFWWIWQKLAFVLGGLFLPLELYPEWLQRVTLVLPFRWILHGPARTVVAWDPAHALRSAAGLLAWTVACLLILAALEGVGRRRVHVNGG